MTKCQSFMRSEDGKPQIKYKGIHEPKGRVKGYRVEIRPSNSQKIWVGTFDSRIKAMRAFDAAVYLTGKEPYYFIYPDNYFPTRPIKPPRDIVQSEAKKFADRTDALKENPSSFLVDTSKACSVEPAPDVKAVKVSDPFVNLDESLKEASYLRVSAEQIPALEETTYWDLPIEETKFVVEETRFGGEEVKFGDELKVGVKELAAFDKGYYHPDRDLITDLLHQELSVDILPWIEGEPSIPFLAFAEDPSYSSRSFSKRKRDATEEDAITLPIDTDVGEIFSWLDTFPDPVNQCFDWFATNSPPLCSAILPDHENS